MVHVSPSVAQRVLQDYERQRNAQMDLPTSACPEAAASRGEDSLAVVVRQARDNDTSQQLYVWWKKDFAGINCIGEKMTRVYSFSMKDYLRVKATTQGDRH